MILEYSGNFLKSCLESAKSRHLMIAWPRVTWHRIPSVGNIGRYRQRWSIKQVKYTNLYTDMLFLVDMCFTFGTPSWLKPRGIFYPPCLMVQFDDSIHDTSGPQSLLSANVSYVRVPFFFNFIERRTFSNRNVTMLILYIFPLLVLWTKYSRQIC